MMTRLSIVVLVVVAARLTSSVQGLSTHSPRDLFAHPQYQIVLSDDSILNTTAIERLQEARSSDKAALLESPSVHLLRTPAGQAFLCSVPAASTSSPSRSSSQRPDAATRKRLNDAGLARGLELLEGMRAACLYMRQGYFTYSFCYGQDIRQFHEIRVTGSSAPSPDPSVASFTLGQFPASVASRSLPKYGSGSNELASKNGGMKVEATLGGDGGEQGEGGRYLVQKWEGGTICDKSGLPRTIEVHYHCNTASTDRIALIREIAICQYVLLLHTPRLCSEPLFVDSRDDSQEPAAVVQCRPIVDRIGESAQGRTPAAALSLDDLKAPKLSTLSSRSKDEEVVIAPVVKDAEAETERARITVRYNIDTGEIDSATTSDGMSIFDEENIRSKDGVLPTREELMELAEDMKERLKADMNSRETSSEVVAPPVAEFVGQDGQPVLVSQEMVDHFTQLLKDGGAETVEQQMVTMDKLAATLGNPERREELMAMLEVEKRQSSPDHEKLRDAFAKKHESVEKNERLEQVFEDPYEQEQEDEELGYEFEDEQEHEAEQYRLRDEL